MEVENITAFGNGTSFNDSSLFNLTSPASPHPADEDFSETLVRFGLSVLIVGFVLLGALGLLVIGHRLSQQRAVRKAMARRLAAGEGQYANPGELLEEEEQVARGGVLVIHTDDQAENNNPRERLAATQRRPSDYEATATSMAKYVQRNSLPQATV